MKFHSGNKIIECKSPAEWKIQLTISIIFISSKGSVEIRKMHTKGDNTGIMMGSDIEEIIKGLSKSREINERKQVYF